MRRLFAREYGFSIVSTPDSCEAALAVVPWNPAKLGFRFEFEF